MSNTRIDQLSNSSSIKCTTMSMDLVTLALAPTPYRASAANGDWTYSKTGGKKINREKN